FAAVVSVFDADLERVLELFRARGLDRTAVWVFTSDRGQPLGEHGLIGLYRPWLHEELVHIPLIIRLPEAAEAGRRVMALTQPADLTPTLLEWFGASALPNSHGFSLTSLLEGRDIAVRTYACSGLVQGPAGEWSIRSLQWALLFPALPHPDDETRETTLFEKPEDRWEVNDLHSRNPEKAEELGGILQKCVGMIQRPGPLTEPVWREG